MDNLSMAIHCDYYFDRNLAKKNEGGREERDVTSAPDTLANPHLIAKLQSVE